MTIEVSKVKIYVLVFSALTSTYTLAAAAGLPTAPGATISGYTGDGWTTAGDALLPIFGLPLNFTYIDPQIYYHSRQGEYSANLGLGQRWLTENNIWGTYVFADYNHSQGNQNFWFVSPGIERLGRTWDFSANGYIPVTQSRFNTGVEFADQAGDSSQVHFSGHDQYDQLVDTFESTGWGADAQVGMHLPWRQIKISVGSYYFSPKNNHEIIGGAIRADLPLNNYLSASFSEAYDNEAHNTLRAGLSLSLGGRHSRSNFTDDLSQRLVDPIQRQLIAVSGSAHNGEPVTASIQDTGKTAVELSNIAFFEPDTTPNTGTTSGDGTYENPYQGFSQTNIDSANQQNNRNFYLNSGVYNPEYAAGTSLIALNNDQVYGRQDNFSQSAHGDNRPVLNFNQGGINISGNDFADSINGLVLNGANMGVGITVMHGNDSTNLLTVNITNTSISGFSSGISLSNSAARPENINISNSSVTDNLGEGIIAQNQGKGGLNLAVDHATIENNSGSGVYLVEYQDGNLTVDINHSTINDNAANGIYGASEFNSSTLKLNVENSTINANADNGVQIYNGMSAYNTNTGNVICTINGSNIAGNGQNGIFTSNTSTGSLTLNIGNSTITDNIGNGIEVINAIDSGSVVVNLRRSTVSGNQINGLEVFNEENSGSLDLSISNSTITQNSGHGIFMDNSVSTGDLTATITHSEISDNGLEGLYGLNDLSSGALTLSIANSAVTGNTQNGIFLDNKGNSSPMIVNISHSKISNNGLSGINAINESDDGVLNLSVAGSIISGNKRNGIALNETSSANQLTAEINNSAIVNNNGNAITANNHASATVTRSIINGNAGAISVINGGTVNIENPVYFNGDLNNRSGTIQFNGADVPAGANHANCQFGICTFS